MRKLLLVSSAIILLGLAGCTSKSASSPASSSQVQAPQSSSARQTVDCSIYGKKVDINSVPEDLRSPLAQTQNAMQYVAGDMGNLPKDFPTAPNSTLCGSDKSLNTTYYISPLSTSDLFGFFKKTLTDRACAPTDVIHSQVGAGDYITFTCGGTKGLISADPHRFAYGIVYPSR